ncbi:MAG TPA: STAS/SEC14 domain-containing protein [Flavobacteriales bacterium]|nr:STAS/SEC14 domain-containing protein [Flavobacteriales bacterium]
MNAKEIIRTKNHEIWIDDEGILWIEAMDTVEVELDEVKEYFEIYAKLGCREKKVLQLMDMRKGVTFTKEARDYAAERSKDYFIASACVSDSLAVRMLVNLSKVFYKDLAPVKLFSDIESAKEWLRKQGKTPTSKDA